LHGPGRRTPNEPTAAGAAPRDKWSSWCTAVETNKAIAGAPDEPTAAHPYRGTDVRLQSAAYGC